MVGGEPNDRLLERFVSRRALSRRSRSRNAMPRITFLSLLGLICLCAMPLAAQDAVLGQLYGSGVHAYFGQDYAKAYESLTSAIDGKTQDPRAYYFRGLALLKLGRPEAAEGDFKTGAKLE